MATVIGDVFTESSRFHNMVAGPGPQRQRTHSTHSDQQDPHYRNRSASRSRDTVRDAPASHTQAITTTTQTPQPALRHPSRGGRETGPGLAPTETSQQQSSTGGASRFPSPPSSTSSESSSAEARPQHGTGSSYMASSGGEPSASARLAPSTASSSAVSTTSTAITVIPAHPASNQIPSPASDSGPRWNNSLGDLASQAANAPPRTNNASPVQTQTTIHVRDLAHIESLARADMSAGHGSGILNDPPLQAMKYEISAMPINDIIEMVAALLTKITTTNDKQHDALNRNAAHIRQAQAAASRSGDPNSDEEHMSPLSSSVLAFHGKNVPAITIMSYLSRIHKYCPTTYEVFLSLLVYFDRMTERVNDMVVKAEDARRQQQQQQQTQASQSQAREGRIQPGVTTDPDTVMRDDSDESDEVDSDLADDDDTDEPGSDHSGGGAATGTSTPELVREPEPAPFSVAMPLHQATYFVVDSYNIHRLVIAGVTCASKFFSDVFYTNSRYAKVGGLPLPELNHLELQFLLLNDFRLAVPVEDLEAYATMLVEFYAREVASQRSRPATNTMDS